jgi:hypothetical protein
MTKCILCCVSILALVAAAVPAHAADPSRAKDDCEARISKLDASDAEGEERLAEKREVIDYCFSQYKNDKAIQRLVMDCAKYEEQPVVKQQFVAECQLAAFNYANALRTLKEQYRK